MLAAAMLLMNFPKTEKITLDAFICSHNRWRKDPCFYETQLSPPKGKDELDARNIDGEIAKFLRKREDVLT